MSTTMTRSGIEIMRDHESQAQSVVLPMPLALAASVRVQGVESLNQLLADLITLRDLYKKHHWQAWGPAFYSLHLLFDKHSREQDELVDLVAERVQTLGGVAIAMAHDVAEVTLVPRAPRGRESTSAQLNRLLHAHEIVLLAARAMSRAAAERGDAGTDDLLVSGVIRVNELQVWFVRGHLELDAGESA